MTFLVLGADGQVGTHLQALLPAARFWRREHADLADPERVRRSIVAAAPSAIINAAAYTAVDRAETEPELAWRVNAESAAAIAMAASTLAVPLIHLSTDYVFDGASDRPYRENDGTRPINVYGRSKLAGELAVASLCERHWILRTSWVFSEHGSNFVKTMLRLARERDRLSVVADQRGRPSYAGDLARTIVALVRRFESEHCLAPGIYHTGGGPETCWYDFARRIFSSAQPRGLIPAIPRVDPIPTHQYPTAAARPMVSTLEPNHAFQRELDMTPDWREGLEVALDALNAASPAGRISPG